MVVRIGLCSPLPGVPHQFLQGLLRATGCLLAPFCFAVSPSHFESKCSWSAVSRTCCFDSGRGGCVCCQCILSQSPLLALASSFPFCPRLTSFMKVRIFKLVLPLLIHPLNFLETDRQSSSLHCSSLVLIWQPQVPLILGFSLLYRPNATWSEVSWLR